MNETAKTIFRTLGGLFFIASTGACNFLQEKESLHFTVPLRDKGNPIRRVRVERIAFGTYNAEFYGVDKSGQKYLCVKTQNITPSELQSVVKRHVEAKRVSRAAC